MCCASLQRRVAISTVGSRAAPCSDCAGSRTLDAVNLGTQRAWIGLWYCALLGCGGASAANAGASKASKPAALVAPDGLRREQYEDAITRYENACQASNAQACGYLAFMYDNAFGVPTDIGRAVELSERSCGEGGAYGCSYLGYLYRLGRGVARDDERAAKLFRRGCEDNDLSGCVGLAIMYKSGLGVPRDAEYAVRLFRRACDQGEALACYSLGYMYANGEGVDRDLNHASQLFDTACESGDRVGCEAAKQLQK